MKNISLLICLVGCFLFSSCSTNTPTQNNEVTKKSPCKCSEKAPPVDQATTAVSPAAVGACCSCEECICSDPGASAKKCPCKCAKC